MDRQSAPQLNRKWHICLFLLGLHIHSETALGSRHSYPQTCVCVCASGCAGVCKVCVTINLYFEISKSASCLSGKDIHSIFVSQMIPQRSFISAPDASDFHSNQVCKVAEQRWRMNRIKKNAEQRRTALDTSLFHPRAFKRRGKISLTRPDHLRQWWTTCGLWSKIGLYSKNIWPARFILV